MYFFLQNSAYLYALFCCMHYSAVCTILQKRTKVNEVRVFYYFYTVCFTVNMTGKRPLLFIPWQTCSLEHHLDLSGKYSAITRTLDPQSGKHRFEFFAAVSHWSSLFTLHCSYSVSCDIPGYRLWWIFVYE